MTIAVTGANGFVGRHVIAEVLERAAGARIRGLIRDEVRFADVDVAGTRSVLAESKRAGVRRVAHLSVIGASATSEFPYLRSRGIAQELVESSSIPHVVVRPYCSSGKATTCSRVSCSAFAFRSCRFPAMVERASSRCTWPISRALSRSHSAATRSPESGDVGGPNALIYDEIVVEAMRAVGKGQPTLHGPAARLQVPSFRDGLLPGDPPVTTAQLDPLSRDDVPPDKAIERVFGARPRPLRGALEYLKTR